MAMFDGFSEEDFKKAIEANPEAWGKPLTSGLNNGSPEGNPGFSSVGGSGGGLVWTGEQPFTQADKDQFANWSNAQTGGDMAGDFETQTLQDHYKREMERYGPGMKYSDSFMAVVNGTDSYLGESYQKERELDKAVDLDFGVGMSTKKAQEQQIRQNAKTEANATVPVGMSNLNPTPDKGMFDGMSQAQVAQEWQANPEGFKQGMLENPEAWGFSRYNTLDNGRLIGINAEGGGNRVLDLGYDEGGNVNTGGPKGEFNDSLGVSQRPDSAPAGSYLPGKPEDMSEENVKNWHSYYRNNPELQEHLSLDERQDLKYLDYLTGNYEGGYKEYKEDSYALRNEFGLDRHYSVPGRDSHRFEYQFEAPKRYDGEDIYGTFADTHEDIGGFYKQEGLPGQGFIQDTLAKPGVGVAISMLMPYAAPAVAGALGVSNAVASAIMSAGVAAAGGGDMKDIILAGATSVGVDMGGKALGDFAGKAVETYLPAGEKAAFASAVKDAGGEMTKGGFKWPTVNQVRTGVNSANAARENNQDAAKNSPKRPPEDEMTGPWIGDQEVASRPGWHWERSDASVSGWKAVKDDVDEVEEKEDGGGGSTTANPTPDSPAPNPSGGISGGEDLSEDNILSDEIVDEDAIFGDDFEAPPEIGEDTDTPLGPEDPTWWQDILAGIVPDKNGNVPSDDPFEDTTDDSSDGLDGGTASEVITDEGTVSPDGTNPDGDVINENPAEGENPDDGVVGGPGPGSGPGNGPGEGGGEGGGEIGKSFASGGGGTEAEWTELFPYTKITALQKKKLLPMVKYIKQARGMV